jgi:hypothetical protein
MGQVIGKGDVYAGSKDRLWTGAGEGKMAYRIFNAGPLARHS